VDHDGGQLVADLSKRNDVGRILAFQARRVRRNKRIYLQALQRVLQQLVCHVRGEPSEIEFGIRI